MHRFDHGYDEKTLGEAEGYRDGDDDTGAGAGKGGKRGKGGMAEEEEDEETKAFLEAVREEKLAQEIRNQSEFVDDGESARQVHEGFRNGLYLRIVIKVSAPHRLERLGCIACAHLSHTATPPLTHLLTHSRTFVCLVFFRLAPPSLHPSRCRQSSCDASKPSVR